MSTVPATCLKRSDVCGHHFSLRYRLRINVCSRVRENTARDVFEDTRLEDLYAGEHQRLLLIDRHPTESFDPARFGFHDGEAFATSAGKQH